MIKETIELVKLIASEGMILTNGSEFAKEAYIGDGDSVENWYEISIEEYESLL